jgi:Inositol hexakisphosphate
MGTDMNAIARPYRTGIYLIFDNEAGRPESGNHFRSGRDLDPPLRASGSHQLDARVFAGIVTRIADEAAEQRGLLIVDLRQESHAFLDGRAVSWCADKDWSNVGQPTAWIVRDEEGQLTKLAAAPDQLVYTIHKDTDGRIQVLGTSPLHVTRAETEEMVVAKFQSRLVISHLRLPVTDHCAPEDDAVRTFLEKLGNLDATTWVHFHCHGGDGRTTTFLTMYDMLNVAKARPPLTGGADLEYFRARQLRLFHYDVRPNPTTKRWQAPFSEERWRRLQAFRQYVFDGYAAGQPWPGFAK